MLYPPLKIAARGGLESSSALFEGGLHDFVEAFWCLTRMVVMVSDLSVKNEAKGRQMGGLFAAISYTNTTK